MSTNKPNFSLSEDNNGYNHGNSHDDGHRYEGDFPLKTPVYVPADLEKPQIFEAKGRFHIFTAGDDYRSTLRKIEQGVSIIVEGSYSTAIAFYSWLKKRVALEYPVTDYISSRVARGVLHDKTSRILVRIGNHQINLERAPEIPWLRIFYPGKSIFLISLPDILGMNGAWQWYKNGIKYKVVEHSLHPYYGVYFPTRTGHLEMFDNWLSLNSHRYSGAVDIGTGCGILSYIMAAHGIRKIHATDINPNAVYSTLNEVVRLNYKDRIDVEKASFFGSINKTSALTVFNPPWIPGEAGSAIDLGMYYEGGFFEHFFKQAGRIMEPGSTLVLIFSNFAIEAGITKINPIEQELLNNNEVFVLEEKITARVTERTSNTSKSWINRIRARENTELWILKKI